MHETAGAATVSGFLDYTLFGSLASNAAPIRYNLRIVTDIAIVGPRTLATAGA